MYSVDIHVWDDTANVRIANICRQYWNNNGIRKRQINNNEVIACVLCGLIPNVQQLSLPGFTIFCHLLAVDKEAITLLFPKQQGTSSQTSYEDTTSEWFISLMKLGRHICIWKVLTVSSIYSIYSFILPLPKYFHHLKTPLPLTKMAAISQTISSDAFSWMKSFVFRLPFHWRLFLWV